MVFDEVDAAGIHQGSYVGGFRTLLAWEVLRLLGVSRASSWCLQSVIIESKRTLEVPGRSLGGFLNGGCLKDTSRKLLTNFQISACLGSTPSPMCLQSFPMESKRTLEVPERSLGGS